MATQVEICNRALQLVGADAIITINDNSARARALRVAYDSVKLRLLGSYFWNFAIKRASLAASSTPPSFGFANAFPLPVGYVTLMPPDQFFAVPADISPAFASPGNQIDWQIEGGQILTNDGAPLKIRYISSDVTEAMFHPLFAEAFSADLALQVCETVTQSSGKKGDCEKAFDYAIELAKQRNAFENQPTEPPLDSWISMRV